MDSGSGFGYTLSDGGRDTEVYKLQDFATSIILYSGGNTPINSVIKTLINSNQKRIFQVNGEPNKELSESSSGYEIKF